MVYMSNQETALQAGHYSPTVHYSQSAKAPMPIQREPNVDTKSDWAGAIADSFGKMSSAFANAAVSAEKTKQENAEVDKYNSFAMRFSKITEAQRQGVISPFQADTEIRAVEQEGLAAGIPQDKLKTMRDGYSGGLPELEEKRQDFYNKKQWEDLNKLREALVAANPGLQRLTTNKQYSLINDILTSTDNLGRLNEILNTTEPGSPAYIAAKTQLEDLQKNDMRTQFILYVSNMSDFNKDITESTIAEAKKVAVAYGRSRGMSDAEAGLMYDLTVRDLGITGAAGINKDIYEFSNAELKRGIDNLVQGEKYSILSTIPGAAAADALNLKDAINDYAQSSGEGRAFLNYLQNSLLQRLGFGYNPETKSYERAAEITPASAIPVLLNRINNNNTSSLSSPKIQLTGSNYLLETVNSNFLPTPEDSSSTSERKFLNLQGVTRRLNKAAMEKVADTASKSSDVSVAEEGRQLKDRITKTYTAEEYYASIGKDTELKAILNDPDIRKNLRYTEDGKLFYKDPNSNEGVFMSFLRSIPTSIFADKEKGKAQLYAKWSDASSYLVGADNTLGDKINKLNEATQTYVSDPVALYEMFQIAPAEIGDKEYVFNTEDSLLKDMASVGQWLDEKTHEWAANSPLGRMLGNKTATATVSSSETIGGTDVSLSSEKMQQMDEQYKQQVAQELLDKADALEESTANLDAAAKKEYGAGNKKWIQKARDKAAELLTAQASVSSSTPIANASVALMDEDITTAPEQSLEDRVTEIRDNVIDFVKDVFHTEYSAKDLNKLQARLNLANRVGDKEHAAKLVEEIKKIMPEVKYKRDKELINKYMTTLQEMILSDNEEMRQNGIDFMREILQ